MVGRGSRAAYSLAFEGVTAGSTLTLPSTPRESGSIDIGRLFYQRRKCSLVAEVALHPRKEQWHHLLGLQIPPLHTWHLSVTENTHKAMKTFKRANLVTAVVDKGLSHSKYKKFQDRVSRKAHTIGSFSRILVNIGLSVWRLFSDAKRATKR